MIVSVLASDDKETVLTDDGRIVCGSSHLRRRRHAAGRVNQNQIDFKKILHEVIIGVGSLILDSFDGSNPIGEVTVTVPGKNDIESDFGCVSGDLTQAIRRNTGQ